MTSGDGTGRKRKRERRESDFDRRRRRAGGGGGRGGVNQRGQWEKKERETGMMKKEKDHKIGERRAREKEQMWW